MKIAYSLQKTFKNKFKESKIQAKPKQETSTVKTPRLTISAQQKMVEKQKIDAALTQRGSPEKNKIPLELEKEVELVQINDISADLTKNGF